MGRFSFYGLCILIGIVLGKIIVELTTYQCVVCDLQMSSWPIQTECPRCGGLMKSLIRGFDNQGHRVDFCEPAIQEELVKMFDYIQKRLGAESEMDRYA